MALYNNHSQESPIAAVEFLPVPEGNTAFFYLKQGADVERVKQIISGTLGQQIDTETKSGRHVVIGTHGNKTQDEALALLKERGDSLTLPPDEKNKLNMWKLRGLGSMIGQPMQLISGML